MAKWSDSGRQRHSGRQTITPDRAITVALRGSLGLALGRDGIAVEKPSQRDGAARVHRVYYFSKLWERLLGHFLFGIQTFFETDINVFKRIHVFWFNHGRGSARTATDDE